MARLTVAQLWKNVATASTSPSRPSRRKDGIAYFIELTFPSGGLFPFKFTTGVRVAPDVLPFGPPPEMVRSQQDGSH